MIWDRHNAFASHAGRGAEQRLVEEVGPGLSLNGLGLGRASFQSYLDRSSSQAGMLATGALHQQARQALRYAPVVSVSRLLALLLLLLLLLQACKVLRYSALHCT